MTADPWALKDAARKLRTARTRLNEAMRDAEHAALIAIAEGATDGNHEPNPG